MKAILIDELIKSEFPKEQVFVTINGTKMKGYQIAKPINYDKKHTTFKQRFLMSINVLFGKAIAVQFFSDLAECDKIEYVKKQLQ